MGRRNCFVVGWLRHIDVEVPRHRYQQSRVSVDEDLAERRVAVEPEPSQ